jgi:hypothetical protein
MMRLLEYLAEVFIGTFGITQPSPEKRRQISIILGGFIFVAIVGGFAVVMIMLYSVRSR